MRGFKSRLISFSIRSGRLLVVGIFASVSLLAAVPPRSSQVKASHGSGAHMILFWDGPTVPNSDWEFVTEAEGRFVRGESPANYGQTGGTSTHSHTATNITVSEPSGANLDSGGGSTVSHYNHSHPTPSVSFGSANHIPSYCNLRLIRFKHGIPNIIPGGAIAIFDDSPGIPTGWTRVSSRDNRMTRIDSTVSTCASPDGGSDTHTHQITWGSLGASTGGVSRNVLLGLENQATAPVGHTHTAPAPTDAPSATSLPPYVQILLAKANADTPTLSVGLTSMFDADPGGGWVVRSSSGGPYNQRFLRGGASYNQSPALGSATHSHATATSGPTGGASSAANNMNLQLFPSVARSGHTHTISADSTTQNHIPPYFNVVIAEKVNFILEYYAWFEDSNNQDVTDPWSPIDVQENQMIPSLPAQYRPPDVNDELRLRVQILVNNSALSAGEMQFKLQYKAGTDAVCTTGTWTDVGNNGSSEIWTFASSSVTDGTDLTVSRMTTHISDVLQIYAKSQTPGTNPRSVAVGQRMEYDFHIVNNGAMPATQYSFRVVEDSGILLSQYGPDAITPICPTLVTKPGTENQMRHGNFFQDGVEQGFSWVD